MQKFWNCCCHYQVIYDWRSPLNKPSDLWFILTQQYGGSGYGKSSHLSIFTSLKHLMMLLKWGFFSGLHGYTLSETLIFFLKWKIVLNSAFNKWLKVTHIPTDTHACDKHAHSIHTDTYHTPLSSWVLVFLLMCVWLYVDDCECTCVCVCVCVCVCLSLNSVMHCPRSMWWKLNDLCKKIEEKHTPAFTRTHTLKGIVQ